MLLAQIVQLAPHEDEALPAALRLNDTELALVPSCYRERVLGYDCPNRFVEVRAIDAGGDTILPGETGEIETEAGRYAVRLVQAEQDILESGDCFACAPGRLVALEAELALLEAR